MGFGETLRTEPAPVFATEGFFARIFFRDSAKGAALFFGGWGLIAGFFAGRDFFAVEAAFVPRFFSDKDGSFTVFSFFF